MAVHVAELQRGARVPRAELVERLYAYRGACAWRIANAGAAHVAEDELVRDVLYLLQGLSGRHVRVKHEWMLPGDAPSAAATPTMRLEFDESAGSISAPTKDMVHRLAELGQLFVRVSRYVDTHTHRGGSGLVAQSLCHFISHECSSYFQLVADLEAQWLRQTEGADVAPPLTLLRLVQYTREALLHMRLLSKIVESGRDAHGGALVSTIHTYTLTGDPFIRAYTAALLDHVSRPFFQMLSRWIYDGELHDPFHEFFVVLQAPSRPQEPDAADVWHHKFALRADMVPSFLGEPFAQKIFSTGKSINFLRRSCEGDWAAMHGALHADGRGRALRYTDMVGLEHAIDAVFAIASAHLSRLFIERFHLFKHMRALRDYLLLVRGDFADELMQALGPSLARPANSLYQHQLSAALETAIRASNAQHDDADVLQRLDARSLEFQAGDTGWDTFALEYRVESPVSAVLDASAMAGYQILFNYLWKIRRTEVAVHVAWSTLLTTQNAAARSCAQGRADGDEARLPVLTAQMHATLARLGEMTHFVRQLQGFCELEVIAYSWYDLEQAMAQQHAHRDLDQLIELHRAYLGTLMNKALLRGGRRGHGEHLADEVRAQLDAVLEFSAAAEELARLVTTELARLASDVPPLASASRSHANVTERLNAQHAAFQERIVHMLVAIERHPNLAVRDLAVRAASSTDTAPLEL